MSFRLVPFLALIFSLIVPPLHAQQAPPRDNPYDVIGKVFSPFWSVLLAATKSPNKACTMTNPDGGSLRATSQTNDRSFA